MRGGALPPTRTTPHPNPLPLLRKGRGSFPLNRLRIPSGSVGQWYELVEPSALRPVVVSQPEAIRLTNAP
jgi:hypothetical protein